MADDRWELLRGGHALLVGLTDPHGAPFATRGWGVLPACDDPTAGPDVTTLRLVVDADDVARFPGGGVGAPVALTGADPLTLRSVQVKGRIESVDAAGPDDVGLSSRHRRATFDAIRRADGSALHLLERLTPRRLAVFTIRVHQFFDQTPGPEAGSPVGDDA